MSLAQTKPHKINQTKIYHKIKTRKINQPSKKPKIESIDIGSALDSSTLDSPNPSSQNQMPQQDSVDFIKPSLGESNLESLESSIK
ncbi:hypothetical protein [Helicobacter sp. T3_23-1059]